MKVGTDGVLLGAWCDVSDATRALDVGTGCGVIALMIAQRNAHCIIDCIDIDEYAIDEAWKNVTNSPWSDRIFPSVADFKYFKPQKKYDIIVSNPPFFDNGILAPEKSRQNARHNVELSLEQLFGATIPLLTERGKLSMITPCDAENDIAKLCEDNLMYISKKTYVFTKPGKKAKRCLWEISKEKNATFSSVLHILNEDGSFSDQYVALCHDFYLNM